MEPFTMAALGLGATSLAGGALSAFAGGGQDVERISPAKQALELNNAKKYFSGESYLLNLVDALRDPNVSTTALRGYLTGSPGGMQSLDYEEQVPNNRRMWLEAHESIPAGAEIIGRNAAGQVQIYVPRGVPLITRTRQFEQPAYEGLLPYLRREVNPLTDLMQAESQRRQGAYSAETLRALGPSFLAAYQTTQDPGRVRGMELLQQSANEQMAAGGALDPAMRREYEQAVRAAQASRGRGFGNMDVYEEAFSVGQAAEARRARAQEAMTRVLGLRAGTDADVAGMILNRPNATAANQGFALQAAGQTGAGGFDPYQNLDALYNANAQNAANIASANQSGAMGGALVGGGLGLFGSYLSGLNK